MPTRQLLHELQQSSSPNGKTGEKVYIPDTAEHAYWAYEQLRNAVEYQEQHLLMRSSIGRFLARHFDGSQAKQGVLGYEVIRELTKAGYLANGIVSQPTVDALGKRIAAYRTLYETARPHFRSERQLFDLVVGIASADIQHMLLPNPAQDALINFTYHSFQTHFESDELTKTDNAVALYVAVHRALLKSDMPTIHHYMFTNQFPQWFESKAHIAQAAGGLKHFTATAKRATQGRRAHAISRMVRTHIAPYIVLYHTLQDSPHPEKLLADQKRLTARVAEVTNAQYKKARERLAGSVLRAIIFLFITKMLVGLLIEVPYEYYVFGEPHYTPLIINLLFPPVYMLLIGLSIKTPKPRNTDVIVRKLRALLYEDGSLRYSLKRSIHKDLSLTFNVVYGICTLAVIGGLSLLLRELGFSFVSGVIFFIFLSTVSFFGYRISQSVRELVVIDRRNILDMLWGILMTPFIRIGQWLSDRYSQFNIFMLVLDFLIEAPYKTLLRVYEQWMTFLREKQDDVLK